MTALRALFLSMAPVLMSSGCLGRADSFRLTKPAGRPMMAENETNVLWIVGTAAPGTLLVYKSEGRSDRPSFCGQPAAWLQELRTRISQSATKCRAVYSPDLDGSSSVKLVCPLNTDVPSCTDVYSASLWTERDDSSTTDYSVRYYGWAKRVCDRPASGAPAYARYDSDESIRQAIGAPSLAVQKLVSSCQ